ncbi:hypothetical protein [Saccharothrix deserti]|uniref:hypothetical protein n=1 Tax=Saccharothrix deserti TaxID=2593674 RepID=UPI00131EBED0|nr:hypothetical protein [Saccharothrix deserti]
MTVDPSEIEAWLKRTGYPFEMQVANAFRQGGASSVSQSNYYHDVTTGEIREGDVLAQWPGSVSVQLEVAIECKSPTTPWVIFTDRHEFDFPFSLRHWLDATPQSGMTAELITSITDQIDEDSLPLLSLVRFPGYGVTEKKNEDKSRSSGVGSAYDAVRQAASFALGLSRRYDQAGQQMPNAIGLLSFPMVVTRSPLFECWLGIDNEPKVQSVDISSVHVYLGSPPQHLIVTICNESGLTKLVKACDNMMQSLSRSSASMTR